MQWPQVGVLGKRTISLVHKHTHTSTCHQSVTFALGHDTGNSLRAHTSHTADMESLLALGADSGAHRGCEITHTAKCVFREQWLMQIKCRCGFSQAVSWEHWDSSVHPVVQTRALVFIYVQNTEDATFNTTFKINNPSSSRGCCCPFM